MFVRMIDGMNEEVQAYLAQIGRRGGQKSKRALSPEEARAMVRIREARRAFRRYYSRCFWSFDPNFVVTENDIEWVVDQLQKNGGWEEWQVAERLCH